MNARARISSASILEVTIEMIRPIVFSYRREGVRMLETLRDRLLISGYAFEKVLILEKSHCEVATAKIDVMCEGEWKEFWVGTFTLADCIVNRTKCTIEAQVTRTSKYDCLIGKYDVDVNIYNKAPSGWQRIQAFVGYYEKYCCDYAPDGCLETPHHPCESIEMYEYENVYDVDDSCLKVRCYQRVIANGTCEGGSPVPPSDFEGEWNLLSDNCPGAPTYWRGVSDLVADREFIQPMTRGQLFNEVLEYIVDEMDCGLTVVSDFFNINPAGDAPVNRAYLFAQENLQTMTMHQKSDVKRPNATDPALSRVYDIKLSTLLADLSIMFNVFWTITDDDELRIEHISYFDEALPVWDLTSLDIVNQYEIDKTNNEKIEQFFWMDRQINDYFKGSKVEYDCGSGVKDNRVQMFTTDVVSVQNTANAESILDDGYVLCSTREIDGVVTLWRRNRVLSWFELHESLHRYGRLHPTGLMNGNFSGFYSWRKRRKAVEFTHYICCDEEFVADSRISTVMGNGVIESAEYDPTKGTLKIIATYE